MTKNPCPYGIGSFGKTAYDVIELALGSPANLAVVPIQDFLELENGEGRMNTPSVADGNRTFRLNERYRTASLIKRIADITERTGRATK